MKPYSSFYVVAQVICAALLFLALPNQPYVYYKILRWFVFLTTSLTAIRCFKADKPKWVLILAFLFVGIAALFNPIFPVYLKKTNWQIIDIITAVIFIAQVAFSKKLENYLN
jgi:hypothetical protein